MASAALIIGEPGSGKSTAIRTLDPKSTFVIDVAGKGLPFQGWRKAYIPFNSKTKEGNYAVTSEVKHIVALMDIINKEMPHISAIVVDDTNYTSGFELMNKINDKTYEKFNQIAHNTFTLITKYHTLRDDLVIFYLNHPEVSENIDGEKRIKPKTAGVMIDRQLEFAGLFKIAFFARARREGKVTKHIFETQTDGVTPSKTPMGMFDQFEVPNDLEYIRQQILKYDQ